MDNQGGRLLTAKNHSCIQGIISLAASGLPTGPCFYLCNAIIYNLELNYKLELTYYKVYSFLNTQLFEYFPLDLIFFFTSQI